MIPWNSGVQQTVFLLLRTLLLVGGPVICFAIYNELRLGRWPIAILALIVLSVIILSISDHLYYRLRALI